jgi:hypothetical protein
MNRTMVTVVVAVCTAFGASFVPNAPFESTAGLFLSRIPANAREADREKTLPAKVLKVLTGYSVTDQERCGWRGCENSIFNRPLGTIGADIGFDWRPFGVPKPMPELARIHYCRLTCEQELTGSLLI